MLAMVLSFLKMGFTVSFLAAGKRPNLWFMFFSPHSLPAPEANVQPGFGQFSP